MSLSEKDSKFQFTHELRVRYADTDAQGHVFFANYLTFFDEGLSALFRERQLTPEYMQQLGIDTVYADAACSYLGRTYFGDSLLIGVGVSGIGNSSIRFECEARKKENGEVVARGRLVIVSFDLTTRKSTRVPDEVRSRLS